MQARKMPDLVILGTRTWQSLCFVLGNCQMFRKRTVMSDIPTSNEWGLSLTAVTLLHAATVYMTRKWWIRTSGRFFVSVLLRQLKLRLQNAVLIQQHKRACQHSRLSGLTPGLRTQHLHQTSRCLAHCCFSVVLRPKISPSQGAKQELASSSSLRSSGAPIKFL